MDEFYICNNCQLGLKLDSISDIDYAHFPEKERCYLTEDKFMGLIKGQSGTLENSYLNSKIYDICLQPSITNFETFESRKLSYSNHPLCIYADILSHCGFYLLNWKNMQCFYCSVIMPIHDMVPINIDSVWENHALINKNCFYLIQRKGLIFIQETFYKCWNDMFL